MPRLLEENSLKAARVPSLDGLRAVAVVFVLLSHLAAVRNAVPAFFAQYGNFGVHVFFIISGYIITRLLLKEQAENGSISLASFYRRRFFRIIPAAYLNIAFVVVAYHNQIHAADVLKALTFTGNYDAHRPQALSGLWSLGVEEQFYLLWPLILMLFFRKRKAILIGAICAAPVLHVLGVVLNWPDTAFPVIYDSLAIGCLGSVLEDRLYFLASRWFILAGPIAILFQWPIWGHGHTPWPLTHIAIGAFVLHVIRHRYWLLNNAPIRDVGTISYGLYLWQGVLWQTPIWSSLIPIATLCLAALSYHCFEKPILNWSKRVIATDKPLQLLPD